MVPSIKHQFVIIPTKFQSLTRIYGCSQNFQNKLLLTIQISVLTKIIQIVQFCRERFATFVTVVLFYIANKPEYYFVCHIVESCDGLGHIVPMDARRSMTCGRAEGAPFAAVDTAKWHGLVLQRGLVFLFSWQRRFTRRVGFPACWYLSKFKILAVLNLFRQVRVLIKWRLELKIHWVTTKRRMDSIMVTLYPWVHLFTHLFIILHLSLK